MSSKTFLNLLTIAIILLLSAGLMSCKKDSGPTNPGTDPGPTQYTTSFTLNGGGFNNRTITLQNTVGGYDADDNISGIGVAGISGSDSVSFALIFPGSSTGSFPWNDTTSYGLIIIGQTINQNMYVTLMGQGSTTVTGYGNPPTGQITGTFSGKFAQVAQSPDTITVTNGSFKALRVQ